MAEENTYSWIESQYGSRRGLVLTWWHRLLFYIGKYRSYHNIDWSNVERLVFVCKGNVCRSAFAEAAAKPLGVEVISCGIDTVENAPANKMAIEAAKKFAIDLSGHKTTPLASLQFKESDLLIAMEPWQADLLQNMFKGKYHSTLLGMWGHTPLPHIHDPYGLSSAYFNKCFTDIQHAVNILADKLK